MGSESSSVPTASTGSPYAEPESQEKKTYDPITHALIEHPTISVTSSMQKSSAQPSTPKYVAVSPTARLALWIPLSKRQDICVC